MAGVKVLFFQLLNMLFYFRLIINRKCVGQKLTALVFENPCCRRSYRLVNILQFLLSCLFFKNIIQNTFFSVFYKMSCTEVQHKGKYYF